MDYKEFVKNIRTAIQEKLGIDYDIKIQKVTKNNNIILDGLIIRSKDKQFAPIIYLNSYYKHFKQGMPLSEIAEDVIDVYKENASTAPGETKMLLDFNNLKDKVAYKLIQKEQNRKLLEDIPAFEYLDLAIVFYLILGENEGTQMTALIHNSHMVAWGTTKEELRELAMKNTPVLLPPVIRTMRDIMREILKEQFEDLYVEELFDDFMGEDLGKPPLYVLSNRRQMNGSGCILYKGCLEKFASEQEADVVILPSSQHEVILIPDKGGLDYDDLQEMVRQINISEVPVEDVLSDGVYKYDRAKDQIDMLGK